MAQYKVTLAGQSYVFDIGTKKTPLNHQKFLKKIFDENTEAIFDETMNMDDIHLANKDIAHKIIQMNYSEINHEHLDFLISIAGIKGKEFAFYLDVDPTQISQWRRGQKDISRAYWKLCCVILWDLIKNGFLTLDPVLFKRHAA